MSSRERTATSHEATAPTPAEQIEAARRAISHLLRRMRHCPELAHLLSPATQSFELLVSAHALLNETDEAATRHMLADAVLNCAAQKPKDLPLKLADDSIVLPAPQRGSHYARWFGNHFYDHQPDGSGHTFCRHHSDCCSPYWVGHERRIDPLGNRRWETNNAYYVPDDFGTLMEVAP